MWVVVVVLRDAALISGRYHGGDTEAKPLDDDT